MKITPRPYQEQSANDIRAKFKDNQKVIMCLPTGAGKTVTFSYMCQLVLKKKPNAKVLILTDRIELLTQAGGTLASFGIKPFLISSKTKTVNYSANCYVSMIKTLTNRLAKNSEFLPPIDLCIIDEAHEGIFKSIMPYLESRNIFTIGATATPMSSSKKNPLNESFDSIVEGPQISELIDQGHLCKANSYVFEKDLSSLKKRAGEYTNDSLMLNYDCENQYLNVIDAYKSKGEGKKTLVFNCNIAHSRKMNDYFVKAGFNSMNLDSKTSPEDRKRILYWFKTTPDAILNNCGILTKGFDEPTINTIVVNRSTMSLTLFLQMAGRGSRPIKEIKTSFNILDLGNNLAKHGPWESDRNWTEIFNQNKQPTEGVAPMKYCLKCMAMHHAVVKLCLECGYIFPIPKKQEFERMGIVEFERSIPENLARPLRELSLSELIERAKIGGKTGKPYGMFWIVNQISLRANAYELLKEYQILKNYKDGWLHRTANKYKIYPKENTIDSLAHTLRSFGATGSETEKAIDVLRKK